MGGQSGDAQRKEHGELQARAGHRRPTSSPRKANALPGEGKPDQSADDFAPNPRGWARRESPRRVPRTSKAQEPMRT